MDELIDIEKVVINGTTYLLVDQQADGGFASVQAAIDAASGGEVILIAPSGFAAGNTLGADNFAFRQVDGSGNYSSGSSAPMFLLDNISADAPSLWYDDNGNGAGAVKIAEFDPTSDLSALDRQHIWLV